MISPVEQHEGIMHGYGVHTFETRHRNIGTGANDVVSVVSQPNWEEFAKALELVPSSTSIVVSPDLITLGGDEAELPASVNELRAQQSAIERRIKQAGEFSGDNPSMIIGLSTPTFNGLANGNGSMPKPRSSFLFMRVGKVVAQNNQQFPLEGETGLFSLDQHRGGRTVRPDLSGIIGPDLVGEVSSSDEADDHASSAIVKHANLVLVSAGVTLPAEQLIARGGTAEEGLKTYAEDLFSVRPEVNELVIANRAHSDAEGPLNAHFVRQTAEEV